MTTNDWTQLRLDRAGSTGCDGRGGIAASRSPLIFTYRISDASTSEFKIELPTLAKPAVTTGNSDSKRTNMERVMRFVASRLLPHGLEPCQQNFSALQPRIYLRRTVVWILAFQCADGEGNFDPLG